VKAVEIILPPGGAAAEVLDVLRWFAGDALTAAEIVAVLQRRQDQGFARAYPLDAVEGALHRLAAADYVKVSDADGVRRYRANVTKPVIPTDQ
jgi:hypothetical protein